MKQCVDYAEEKKWEEEISREEAIVHNDNEDGK